MRPEAETLLAAREALARHAFREAYDLLAPLREETLEVEDLERLGEAAWWVGRRERSVGARERAYARHVERGNKARSAMLALELGRDHMQALQHAAGAGWFLRAERLLEGEPETAAHGMLAFVQAMRAHATGDLEGALAQADRVIEIGTRLRDRNLIALGLLRQGRTLVRMGRGEEGMQRVDEATVAAVGGELDILTTAVVYCGTISACAERADYKRASEWTEAASRWCERQSIDGFPGVCRVHRAEIMRLRGAWAEAEQEARRACEELEEFKVLDIAGEGFYELGEIRLRMGDLAAAEDLFRKAHELGREPQPGLAILRLAQGKADGAAAAIRRRLADDSLDRLVRARLLPAAVRIAIAAADLPGARTAAAELDAISESFDSPAIRAGAAGARAEIRLAEGDAEGAIQSARRCHQLWGDLDAPYEAAQARVVLGRALRAAGEEEAAVLELRAAKGAFERLGADLDARLAAEAIEPGAGTRAARTFLFTDIVGSTTILSAIGDTAWSNLVRWHDQTLRTAFGREGGEEVDHAGDGFFVAFADAAAAIRCAVAIQRTLAAHRRTQGFAPEVRAGMHAAEATRVDGKYVGMGVHAAARIGAIAEGGRILASEETVAGLAPVFPIGAPREVTLRGIEEPLRVVEILWREGDDA